MAIKFNELAEKEYYTLRQEMLSAIEGSRHEVYRDSKGVATIGIGLNLRNKNIARSVLEANLTSHKGTQTQAEPKGIEKRLAASAASFYADTATKNAIDARCGRKLQKIVI